MARLLAAIPVPALFAAGPGQAVPPALPGSITPEDDSFLDGVEKASFQFFWEQAHPETGLVKDRCDVRKRDTTTVASIAATGFGLTALCIGQQRGWVSQADARHRVLATLEFLWKKMPTHRGFFFHYASWDTGERTWESEVSSIDTAILLCGVLTCYQQFRNGAIRRLARAILARVDWSWLSEDTALLTHGWA
ncbi:MAG TPA: hypothetical protein VJ732_08810, partial [Bryobacteraceae bacterium]|nr:hypothetical protein [Bryobacteraceae bacterium]